MVRQGELLIVKVKKVGLNLLKNWNETSRQALKRLKKNHLVLADGEVTGHLHQLSTGTLYADNNDTMFFKVPKEKTAILTHPEHNPLTFTDGLFKVIKQREYIERDLFRRVRD